VFYFTTPLNCMRERPKCLVVVNDDLEGCRKKQPWPVLIYRVEREDVTYFTLLAYGKPPHPRAPLCTIPSFGSMD
jgi:hypothetical protein